jgi:hypothetical protein
MPGLRSVQGPRRAHPKDRRVTARLLNWLRRLDDLMHPDTYRFENQRPPTSRPAIVTCRIHHVSWSGLIDRPCWMCDPDGWTAATADEPPVATSAPTRVSATRATGADIGTGGRAEGNSQ